jgi:hypothetical protein
MIMNVTSTMADAMSMLSVQTQRVHSRALAKKDLREMELHVTITMSVLLKLITVTTMPNVQTKMVHSIALVILDSPVTEPSAKMTTSARMLMVRRPMSAQEFKTCALEISCVQTRKVHTSASGNATTDGTRYLIKIRVWILTNAQTMPLLLMIVMPQLYACVRMQMEHSLVLAKPDTLI